MLSEQVLKRMNFHAATEDLSPFWSSYTDLFIGAPLFMDRSSDGKLQEVGQVTICLQRASAGFLTSKLNGFEIFARFGSSIAPLGDLDQDGFNGRMWILGQDLLVVEGRASTEDVDATHKPSVLYLWMSVGP